MDTQSLNLDSQSLNLDSGDNQLGSTRENKFILYGKKMQESGVSQKLVQDASVIYDAVNEGECFRRSDLAKLLGCSPAKAAYLINAMKASKVIEKVSGIGNGWYRFIKYLDKDEM